ncbi:MAG: hypothetical protein WBC33_07845 [Conexibacter sp.]
MNAGRFTCLHRPGHGGVHNSRETDETGNYVKWTDLQADKLPTPRVTLEELLEHLDDLKQHAMSEGFERFAMSLRDLHARVQDDRAAYDRAAGRPPAPLST